MMALWIILGIVYVVGFIAAVVGSLIQYGEAKRLRVYYEGSPRYEEHTKSMRLAARVFVFAWAWPLLILIPVYKTVAELTKSAFHKTDAEKTKAENERMNRAGRR